MKEARKARRQRQGFPTDMGDSERKKDGVRRQIQCQKVKRNFDVRNRRGI